MEIADALYGVSMRGDGVTTVISQRLREDRDEPGDDDHPEKLDVTEAALPPDPAPRARDELPRSPSKGDLGS